MTEGLLTITVAAIAGLLAGGVVATGLAYHIGRRERRRDQRVQGLEQDVRGLTAGAAGMGKRLVQVEQSVRQLKERQERLELRDSGTQPYAQAIRLVEQGAGTADLVNTCGLTEGEAELVVMLHGARSAAQGQRHTRQSKVVGQ